MNKKAQSAEQIFIYITAIVVIGLIVAYGYSAIKGFTKKGEQVEYITLKTSLENSVKSIASDYGSIKRPDIDISGAYTMICFVDKEQSGNAQSSAVCRKLPQQEQYFEPLVCSGWSNRAGGNVYLIPDGSVSFDVGDIVIKDNYPFMCFEVVNSKIKLQLTGLGDKVEVSKYE